MIDKSIEWLESLYVSGPEADMAKDLLDRLAEADKITDGRDPQLEEALSDAADAQTAQASAEYETRQVIEALGAADVDEAVEMIHALREAFEG